MGFCRLLSMTEPFSRNAPSLLPRGISSLSLYLCQKHITENWREDGRVPRAPPVTHLQLDSTLIQVSKLESDPKVGRTNSTTNVEKNLLLERLGKTERQRELLAEERELCTRRGQRDWALHQGAHMGKTHAHNVWL